MDEMAEAVDGTRMSLTLLYGPRYYAPLRYLALFFKTLLLLFVEKPEIVYAQNPPIFCPLTALLYCRITGRRLVVDHHSVWRIKTVTGPVGRVIGFLEKFVASSAFANTVPHAYWGRRLLESGGRRVEVIYDYVPVNPNPRDEATRSKYSSEKVIAIAAHGGHPLEMIEVEAAAAGRVPGLTLLFTGPEEKVASRFQKVGTSHNVKYLGFLPREEYERVKSSCDFALNVTSEPQTLSHVLFEFAASGLPIIASRQTVVEEIFGDSIQYLDTNNLEEVAAALDRFVRDSRLRMTFRERVLRKHRELSKLHERELKSLRALFR